MARRGVQWSTAVPHGTPRTPLPARQGGGEGIAAAANHSFGLIWSGPAGMDRACLAITATPSPGFASLSPGRGHQQVDRARPC
jgi:hypothetical protein